MTDVNVTLPFHTLPKSREESFPSLPVMIYLLVGMPVHCLLCVVKVASVVLQAICIYFFNLKR